MSAVSGHSGAKRRQYLKAFRFMLLARVLEEKLATLYRAGLIKGGVFLGRGQEALSVSIGISLRQGDIFAPLIRDQAGRLAFGDTVLDTLRTYLGSQLGSMRGRDGNIHRGRPREGYYAMISHLGAMIPVVAGGLMARRFRGETGGVGVTCLGDGGTSTGAFHEGVNREQPVCLFDSEQPAVCLQGPTRQGGRIRNPRASRGWHGSRELPGGGWLGY